MGPFSIDWGFSWTFLSLAWLSDHCLLQILICPTFIIIVTSHFVLYNIYSWNYNQWIKEISFKWFVNGMGFLFEMCKHKTVLVKQDAAMLVITCYKSLRNEWHIQVNCKGVAVWGRVLQSFIVRVEECHQIEESEDRILNC